MGMLLSKLNDDIFQHLYRDITEFRSVFDLPVASPDSLDQQADTLHTSLAIDALPELAEAGNKTEHSTHSSSSTC